MALEKEPPPNGANLTTTQPGLGFASAPAAKGPKGAMEKPLPEQQHVPLTSPGGIVMSGGYLGRQTRTNASE